MTNLGHEKNRSMHSFNALFYASHFCQQRRELSTRALGMCPCGYLIAWHTLRLLEKRSRREAKIITGKIERSQRRCVNFKVGLSVFR